MTGWERSGTLTKTCVRAGAEEPFETLVHFAIQVGESAAHLVENLHTQGGIDHRLYFRLGLEEEKETAPEAREGFLADALRQVLGKWAGPAFTDIVEHAQDQGIFHARFHGL